MPRRRCRPAAPACRLARPLGLAKRVVVAGAFASVRIREARLDQARSERLKAALRENLRRRKARPDGAEQKREIKGTGLDDRAAGEAGRSKNGTD